MTNRLTESGNPRFRKTVSSLALGLFAWLFPSPTGWSSPETVPHVRQARGGVKQGRHMAIVKCPIWGTPADVEKLDGRDGCVVDSPRAGGRYFVVRTAIPKLEDCDDRLKAVSHHGWLNNGVWALCSQKLTAERSRKRNKESLWDSPSVRRAYSYI